MERENFIDIVNFFLLCSLERALNGIKVEKMWVYIVRVFAANFMRVQDGIFLSSVMILLGGSYVSIEYPYDMCVWKVIGVGWEIFLCRGF